MKADLQEEDDINEARPPTLEFICKLWPKLAINAVTGHFTGGGISQIFNCATCIFRHFARFYRFSFIATVKWKKTYIFNAFRLSLKKKKVPEFTLIASMPGQGGLIQY